MRERNNFRIRIVLRTDPNIIMIGEIRDRETAEISIQAALTGHLVFSTLHTNTAPGAITRLLDMGIEPFLAASALRGIVAQRLVRKLCSACRQEYGVDETMWEWKLFQGVASADQAEMTVTAANITGNDTTAVGKELKNRDPHNRFALFRQSGCETCRQSGYRGRMAVHEVLPVSTALKDKIIRHASEQELWNAAKTEFPDLVSLEEDGMRKAKAGVTSVQECLRVLGGEDGYFC